METDCLIWPIDLPGGEAAKKLVRYAESLGGTVEVVPLLPRKAGGVFNVSERSITVSLYSPSGEPLESSYFLFYLAHEVRHLYHLEKRLFRRYYDVRYDRMLEMRGLDPLRDDHMALIPPLQTALAAERDCDRWAINFVRKEIDPTFSAPQYPPEDVRSYRDYLGAMSDKRRGLREKYRPLREEARRLVAEAREIERDLIHTPPAMDAKGSGKSSVACLEARSRKVLSRLDELSDEIQSLIREATRESHVGRDASETKIAIYWASRNLALVID